MTIEVIILITAAALTAGLFTSWYLTQIRNTMVRLTDETTKYRELANAAEAQMSAEREVRELRQLNDELTDDVYTYKLGEASAHEDLDRMTTTANEHLVRRNELSVKLTNLSSAHTEIKADYERVCRQFAEHKEQANQDFNGQKHRENQLIKDNEKLKSQLFCAKDSNENLKRGHQRLTDDKRTLSERLKNELNGRATCERKIEEYISEINSMGLSLNSAEVEIRQLKAVNGELNRDFDGTMQSLEKERDALRDELSDTQEELRSKRLQLDRANKVNEKLNADLDDWESMDDNTDLTPNNPNHSKHPHWHKSKAQGITRVHWHTIASACRTHFEAMYLKAANNKNVSKNEIKRRYYLAQEGINTIEAGRKK